MKPAAVVRAVLLVASLLACVPARAQETSQQAESTSKQQDKLLNQQSGFLGDDYAKLRPDPGNADWLIYFKDSDSLKKSDTFYVEKVKVFLVPEAQQRDIS